MFLLCIPVALAFAPRERQSVFRSNRPTEARDSDPIKVADTEKRTSQTSAPGAVGSGRKEFQVDQAGARPPPRTVNVKVGQPETGRVGNRPRKVQVNSLSSFRQDAEKKEADVDTYATQTKHAVEAKPHFDRSWFAGNPCDKPGIKCKNPAFPFLFFDAAQDGPDAQCSCAAHPCLDDNGRKHGCPDSHPFLRFSYSKPGKPGDHSNLKCFCSTGPQMTTIAAERICGGGTCADPEFSILTVNDKGDCTCVKHACEDDNGVKHTCNAEKFPVLRGTYTESGKLDCECYPREFGGYINTHVTPL